MYSAEKPSETPRIGARPGELFEQSDRAHGVRLGPVGAVLVHERNLDAAAAEIDQEPHPVAQRQPAGDREMDKPRLLGAADGLETQTGFIEDAGDELLLVCAFPDGARRHRTVVLDSEVVHLAPKPGQRRHRAIHGRSLQPAREIDPVAEAYRRTFAGEGFELALADELGGEKADGVGSHIDTRHPDRELDIEPDRGVMGEAVGLDHRVCHGGQSCHIPVGLFIPRPCPMFPCDRTSWVVVRGEG